VLFEDWVRCFYDWENSHFVPRNLLQTKERFR
jgi:hypothetical protein